MECESVGERVFACEESSDVIQPISCETVHRICSGQVVLSLAIAVKELVENAIDAGATIIDIRLEEYGSKLIEVSDNGKGVIKENFQALTLKHYTSKIKQFDDLQTLSTLGFRGEALSSLCALSDLTILTKHATAQHAVKISYDRNGKIVSEVIGAREMGTTVTLENLFSTLPVRRKEFMKNLKREFNKMCQLLSAYCLVSKGIKFSCSNVSNKGSRNTVVSTEGLDTVRGNIINVFGVKQISSLIEIELVRPEESVLSEYGLILAEGEPLPFTFEFFISSVMHGSGRSTTDRQFFYINSRPCEPTKLIKLVNQIYKQYNRNQYPFVYLNIITSNSCLVDVNVTPDKRQVFLEKEKMLLATVKASLIEAFNNFPSTFKMQNVELTQNSTIEDFFEVSSRGLKRSVSDCERGGITKMSITERFKKRSKTENDKNSSSQLSFSSDVINSEEMENITVASEILFNSNTSGKEKLDNVITKNDTEETKISCKNICNKLENIKNIIQKPENESCISSEFTDHDKIKNSGKDENKDRQKEQKQQELKVTDIEEKLENQICVGDIKTQDDDKINKIEDHLNEEEFEKLKDIVIKEQKMKQNEKKTFQNSETISEKKKMQNTKAEKNDDKIEDHLKEEELEKLKDIDVKEEKKQNEKKTFQNSKSLSEEKKTHNVNADDDIILSIDQTQRNLSQRKSVTLNVSLQSIKEAIKNKEIKTNKTNEDVKVRFRSEIAPESNKSAEEELQKHISKEDFTKMTIIGQFNLGFIVTKLDNDLFIIDQHATDEKYNFEQLQANSVMESQILVNPKPLELTAGNQCLLIENEEIFKKNGFSFKINESAPSTKKISLTSVPLSKNVVFGKDEIDEMLLMLQDSNHTMCRPSRIRAVLASRACRKSVMIGKALSKSDMRRLVDHMAEIEQPWNCPHGRPTMRHLINLDLLHNKE